MIATLPAVQANCRGLARYCSWGRSAKMNDERSANRRHRRASNRATRRMVVDPERFYDEGFNAPSLSDWEVW
jgi:hypothetical protein